MPLSEIFGPTPRPTQWWDHGFLPAKLHLNAPADRTRPFGRGEYMDNPDGSWSSEMTYDLSDPRLNAGRASIIPGLWLRDGRPYHANEDEAVQYALQSGLHFPSYDRPDIASAIAAAREKGWQTVPRENAAIAPPLYVPPMGAR